MQRDDNEAVKPFSCMHVHWPARAATSPPHERDDGHRIPPHASMGPCACAQTVMRLVDAIVKQTNTQLSDSSKVLQDILAAAANERGEWDLPLSKAQVGAMRAAMDARPEHLNEARCAYEGMCIA